MKTSEKSGSFGRILQILKSDWKTCLLVVFISILVGAAGAVVPLLRKEVIDLMETRNRQVMQELIIVLVAMFALEWAMEALKLVASHRSNQLRQRTAFRLFSRILERVFQNDLEAHEKQMTGDLLNRIHRGVFGFTEAVFEVAVNLAPAVVFVAFAAGVMFYLDWRLALVAFSLAGLPVLISYKAGKVARDKERDISELWQGVYARLQEAVSLFKTVLAFCAGKREQKRCEEGLKKVQDLDVAACKYQNRAAGGKKLLSYLAQLVILGYGAYLIFHGQSNLGTVVAFIAFTDKLFEPMLALAGTYEHMQKASVHLHNVLKILETEPNLKDVANPTTPARLEGHIEFQEVSFSYGNGERPPVLKKVSFEIRPGQTVALVGRSGSGKTTIAELADRLRDPSAGRITVDGIDLRELPQQWWREHVGLVLQDHRLFAGSIRDNVIYGNPNATADEIAQAVLRAHAAEFIAALPNGYDTLVGEGGVGLSAGEMQRIAIARAIVKNPRVVILDEATSNLDVNAERAVSAALEELRKDRTVLIIAHRLSTIKNADLVLMLQEGEIVERGKFDELIAKQGAFFRMIQEGTLAGS